MSSKKVYLIILLCSSFLCGVSYMFAVKGGEKQTISQISFLCRESAEEYSKSSLKQGIEQAASDFGVELTVQFLNNTGSAQEQIHLLKKEMENKTDAILIEPVNEEKVRKVLEEYGEKVPVVFVNSGIDGEESFPKISCAQEKLGQELVAEILKQAEKNQKVLIISESIAFQDVKEAYRGIEEGLKDICEVEYLELSREESQKEKMLEERLNKNDIHAVVALSSRDLSFLGKMKRKEKFPKSVFIYGIGKNNQIIADMEDGLIQAIGVVNYYSAGYLSVQEAIFKNTAEKEVMMSMIDKEHIYTPQNQRILFTLVQ